MSTPSTAPCYPDLEGRAVLVTGGGAGIGADIVEHFCQQNAKVAFLDRDEATSRALVERLASTQRKASTPHFEPCDLTDIDAMHAAIARAREVTGPFAVLVNNAAHDERHAIEDVTPDYWDGRMEVNLRHQFFAVQALLDDLRAASDGAVVMIGSTTWLIGQGGMPGYSAAKAGVSGLMRSFATDLGPDNIRVNCVLPGWIMTERQEQMWLTPEGEKELLNRQMLKRKLYPPDVSKLVLFLASNGGSGCTGQNFIVDGGWV